MVKVGDRVKDIVSGFTGIVTSRTEWLYGCVRAEVTSEKLKDGKILDLHFDEDGLTVVKSKAKKPKTMLYTTGGARACNSQRKDIVR